MNDRRVMDDTKIALHMDRIEAYFARGERIAPIHIDMGVTKKCNCRCVFCYGEQQSMTGEMIDPQVLVDTLADAPKIGVKSIGLIGDGDPSLNIGLFDGLRAGKNNGLDLAISTNGILINTQERQETILETCTWARFNLNAHNAESYKRLQSVDKFDQVVENIRNMVKLKRDRGYNTDFGLQMVYVPGMMNEEVVGLARLAVEWGVDYLVVKQCSLPVENKAVGTISFDVNEYDNPVNIAALKEAEVQSTAATRIIVKWNVIKQKGMRPYDGCPSIPFLLEISGSGLVAPCGQMFNEEKKWEPYLIGNLHQTSLRDLLSSERYWSIVNLMRTRFDVHKDCWGACRQDKINEWLHHYERSGDWTKRQLYSMWDMAQTTIMGKNFI